MSDSTPWRSSLRPLKRGMAAALQRGWGLAFRAAAHASKPRVSSLLPCGRQRVLIVAPHPDDEAIGCAGTAMLHVDAGDRVCIAIATDGRRFPVVSNPGDMALKRRREAEHAARLMRVDRLAWIGLPEGEWGLSELQGRLRAVLSETRPDIVYAPSRIDFHAEHLKVAHALALALEDGVDIRPCVRVYQVQVPLTALLANLVADVSSLRSRCDAVLAAYPTQVSSMQCTGRQRHYAAERHGIPLQAEEFWEMSMHRYIRLHRAFPTHRPQAFRGMRSFPLTDPLAYLVGRQERREIRVLELDS